MNELISVIVPVYNAEKCLKRCVESIKNQTYKNLEIILVDDGSQDNSSKLCDKLAQEDKRIHVYHKKNGGQASARNYGLQKSTGEYIGFVDNDDEIEPQMYEILLENAKKYEVSISGCSTLMVYENGKEENRFKNEKSGYRYANEIILNILYQNYLSWGTVWNKIFHKRLQEKMLFPEGHELEDYWVMLRLFDKEEKVYFEQKPMYYWYQSKSSQSKRPYHERTKTSLIIAKSIFEYFMLNRPSNKIRRGCLHFMFCVYYSVISAMYRSNDKEILELIPKEGKEALCVFIRIAFDNKNDLSVYKKVVKILFFIIKSDFLRKR